MTIKPTHTPPRQIRIGDDWYDFERATKAMGTERAEVIRDFIAWYLRRPGVTQPKRPDVSDWQPGEGSGR
jgi:hypothetical protein